MLHHLTYSREGAPDPEYAREFWLRSVRSSWKARRYSNCRLQALPNEESFSLAFAEPQDAQGVIKSDQCNLNILLYFGVICPGWIFQLGTVVTSISRGYRYSVRHRQAS